MALRPFRPRNRDDFKVAVICALPLEAELVYKVFDTSWTKEGIDFNKAQGDQNTYTLGAIGKHNVVLVHMPGMGTVSAAAVSAGIRSSFTRIEIAFVVGICGASPIHPETEEQVKLGDCILSTAVIEYDFGKQHEDQFIRKSDIEEVHGRANSTIRSLLNQLKISAIRQEVTDNLYQNLESLQAKTSQARYPEALNDGTTRLNDPRNQQLSGNTSPQTMTSYGQAMSSNTDVQQCRIGSTSAGGHGKPQIHFGRIGSASMVVKSSKHRDKLSFQDKIVGFEMEGAGIWDNLPTIILKSVCDFADENKNDIWQPYAAATAAAGLEAILQYWSASDSTVNTTQIGINLPDHAAAHFIPRVDIQNELFEWLFDHTRRERMVLLGMGGAGKSQLAIACCKEAIGSQSFATVLWLDASSVFSIEQSVKLSLAQLEEGQAVSLDTKGNMAMLTKALQRRTGPFLAVYDNYDTPDVFCNNPITDYMPKAEHGKILFTSRHADSERLGRGIHVSRMSDDESLALLLKRPLNSEAERIIGLQISADLGHLPLALDQAGAYIRARALSLQDFTRHFKHRREKILQEIPNNWEYKRNLTGGERETLLSAWTTWELSLEQISGTEQTKKDKEHFLTLCAFFASLSTISKDYFENYCRSNTAEWTEILMSSSSWDEFLYDDLVGECRKLSLFQNDEQNRHEQASISLHPLIRDWLRLRKTDTERQNAIREVTNILGSYAIAVDFSELELAKRQQLLANALSCIQEDVRFQTVIAHDEVDFASSAERFAYIFQSGGFYNEAMELAKKIVASYREQLGDKHIDTLRAIDRLAIMCRVRGSYDEAEVLLRQVLTGRRELLGPKHPDTLRIMEQLAIVENRKGRYSESSALQNEVLASKREHFGPKHPRTLFSMQVLGFNYISLHRFDEAEILLNEVLAGRLEQLGPKHPETLLVMQNLGITYFNQRRHDDAKALFKEVIAGKQERLGPKHPETLDSMHNLAVIYDKQGKYDEAAILYEEVVAGRQEQLGLMNPYTVLTMYCLADNHHRRGRYDEAEELFTKVLAVEKERLGPNHPKTLHIAKRFAYLSQWKTQSNQNMTTSTD